VSKGEPRVVTPEYDLPVVGLRWWGPASCQITVRTQPSTPVFAATNVGTYLLQRSASPKDHGDHDLKLRSPTILV